MPPRREPRPFGSLLLGQLCLSVLAHGAGQALVAGWGAARLLDLPTLVVVVMAWRLPHGRWVPGAFIMGVIVAAHGLDPLILPVVSFLMAGVLARRLAEWIDLEFTGLQVPAALLLLAASETLTRLTSLLYFGTAGGNPWLGLPLTALLAPLAWAAVGLMCLSRAPRRLGRAARKTIRPARTAE